MEMFIKADLSKYGFRVGEGIKIKPGEKIKYKYIFLSDLEGHMRSWNYALARKLGVTDIGMEFVEK